MYRDASPFPAKRMGETNLILTFCASDGTAGALGYVVGSQGEKRLGHDEERGAHLDRRCGSNRHRCGRPSQGSLDTLASKSSRQTLTLAASRAASWTTPASPGISAGTFSFRTTISSTMRWTPLSAKTACSSPARIVGVDGRTVRPLSVPEQPSLPAAGSLVATAVRGLATRPPRTPSPTQDFGSWVLQTFGEEIRDIFMAPYNFKVWAFPLERLWAGWVGERAMFW